MRQTRFLIPSMLAAGFGPHDPAQASLTYVTTTGSDDPNAGILMRAFTQDHEVTLAQHRSHSSHSSHSSHRSGGGGHSSHMSHTSHRSSTGGYDPAYTAPADPEPLPSPPPPPPPPAPVSPLLQRATPPPSDGLPALSGRSRRFTAIVRRVQLALLAQGFYDGSIDGVVGPSMRSALRRFQESRGLSVTGTITPPTLDALMISSE
jgi:hypothetical protein